MEAEGLSPLVRCVGVPVYILWRDVYCVHVDVIRYVWRWCSSTLISMCERTIQPHVEICWYIVVW